MKTKILSVLTLLTLIGFQSAQAAKLEKIEKLKSRSLGALNLAWNEMCMEFSDWERAGQITCTNAAVRVVSRSENEKWESTVKQSIFINGDGYVSEAAATALKNNEIVLNRKIDGLLKDAGYKRTLPVLNQKIGYVKKVARDEIAMKESILVFNASYTHAFGNGAGFYLIDLEKSEMLELFMNAEE